ncbi:MAG: hypothetical protein ACOC8C_02180, partial [Chloroflexota bacterium]
MSRNEERSGVALLCDHQGIVLEVLRDELDLGERVSPGRPWNAMLDRGSFKKALDLLVELRRRGAVFDWEMNVPQEDQIVTLHF